MIAARYASVLTLVTNVLLSGCRSDPEPLVLLAGPIEPAHRVAEEIAAIVVEQTGLRVDVRPGGDDASNLERLRTGEADLTIAADLSEPSNEFTSLAALYPGVLHVLYRGDVDAVGSLSDLLEGNRVFADVPGSATRELLEALARLEPSHAPRPDFADTPWDDEASVFVSMGGLIQANALRDLPTDLRLFSFDSPHSRSGERVVDGIALRMPHVRPFLIPSKLYSAVRAEPATTLAIQHWLVAPRRLDRDVAAAIVRAISDQRSRLHAIEPIASLSPIEAFDRNAYSYPAHPGALDFLRHLEPTLLERYADLIGLVLSFSAAIASLSIALRNWNRQRRKDRIDAYSERVLEVISAARVAEGRGEAYAEELRQIEREAIGQLVAERLEPDASFQIFLSLCRSAIRDVEGMFSLPGSR